MFARIYGMRKSNRGAHQHKRIEPVTLVFTVTAKNGKEKELEKWAHIMTKEAIKFEGNLGGNWIKPSGKSREYTVIYKFVDTKDSHKWENSAVRKRLLKKAEPLIEEHRPHRLQEVTGLETWFTLPGRVTIMPPPRWKMVIATMIGIYPIGLVYQAYFVPYMKVIPLILRPIALSLLLTPVLTYLIMPRLTKLLRSWLYPEK